MPRRHRLPSASARRTGAWLASLVVHGCLVAVGPSLVFLATRPPEPRRLELTLAERPEVEPALAETESEQLSLEPPETPEEPALVEAELGPRPQLPLESVAARAQVAFALPIEPRWNAVRWKLGTQREGDPGAATRASAGAPEVAAGESTEPAGGAASRGTPASARSCPTPAYPPLSRSRGEEGVVLLRLAIDDHGVVAHAELVESSGFGRLDAAALAGVRSWRFEPATAAGEPVESELLWRVVFRLHAA